MKYLIGYPVLLGILGVTLFALLTQPASPQKAGQPNWIYGPRQTLQTGQEGVVVYCQGKTNSRAFAERRHAAPGDVVIETCRAVRAPEAS